MRRPRIRKLAVVVGTTALFGGAVAGCGGSSSTTATASGAAAQAQPAQNAGPGAMFSTTTLKTLATQLGVSTSELQKALRSARPTGQPGQGGASAPADPQAEMAAALAKALDLSETKVAAALKAVMPSPPGGQAGTRPGGTPPTATTASS